MSTSGLFDLLAQQAGQENAALEQAAAADRQRINDFNTRLQAQLGAVPAQVGADYDKAVAQSAALGQASAQLLAQANPNAQVQADLAAIGAPTAQGQQVQQTLQNAFPGAGAVLFQQGAAIPGEALLAEKAAQQSFYRGLGGQAGQRAQDLLAQVDARYGAERAKLLAEQTGRQVQGYQYEQDYGLKQQAAAQNERVIESQLGDRQFNQRYKAAQLGLAQQRNQQGAARIGLSRLQADRSWQATLKRLGLQEQSVAIRAKQVEGKARKLTPSQARKFSGTAYTIAENAYSGFETTDKNGVVTPHPPIGYQEAILEAYKEGIPLRLILPALNQFYRRGERGRPKLGYYERQKKKR